MGRSGHHAVAQLRACAALLLPRRWPPPPRQLFRSLLYQGRWCPRRHLDGWWRLSQPRAETIRRMAQE